MLVAKVVQLIRLFLNDLDEDRWSNDKLLSVITLAQTDIVSKIEVELTRDISIPLVEDTDTYLLPIDFMIMDNVKLNGKIVNIVDKSVNADLCIISDYLEQNIIKLSTPAEPNRVSNNPEYGINLDNLGERGFDYFSTTDELKVSYLSNGYQDLNMDSNLLLSYTYANAIKLFVCGNLLRADDDTKSVNLGNEELLLYSKELHQLSLKTSVNNTRGVTYTVKYRGIGC